MNCQVERLSPKIVVFSGNTHRPSKSRTLAHHLGEALRVRASVTLSFLDLVDAGRGLGAAFSRKELTPAALNVVDAIEQADALIVTTPVYNGSYAGLFKHMFDLVDPLKLVDRPVLIGATGGGHRHALVVEHQLRPLFGFFSALTVPSAVYASDSDFVDGSLAEPLLLTRATQAVDQLATLLLSRHTGASAASAPRYEQRASPGPDNGDHGAVQRVHSQPRFPARKEKASATLPSN